MILRCRRCTPRSCFRVPASNITYDLHLVDGTGRLHQEHQVFLSGVCVDGLQHDVGRVWEVNYKQIMEGASPHDSAWEASLTDLALEFSEVVCGD